MYRKLLSWFLRSYEIMIGVSSRKIRMIGWYVTILLRDILVPPIRHPRATQRQKGY